VADAPDGRPEGDWLNEEGPSVNPRDARPGAPIRDPLGQAYGSETCGALPQADAADGPTERRKLLFRTSGLAVDLEITSLGETWLVAGRLIPRQSALVDIRHAEGTVTIETDGRGQFSTEAVPPGQARLRCRLGAGQGRACVITGWVAFCTEDGR
jgi:hypothetical protein